MKKLFYPILLLVLIVVTMASANADWTRPSTTGTDSGYCAGGLCAGSLIIPGNLTVVGDYINLTVVNYNVTGDLTSSGNITADHIFAIINSSYIANEYWVDEDGDTMTGNLIIDTGANLSVSRYLTHEGDEDTYLDFLPNNFELYVGGLRFLRLYSPSHYMYVGYDDDIQVRIAKDAVWINETNKEVMMKGDLDVDGNVFDNNNRVCTVVNGLCGGGGGGGNASPWNRSGTNTFLANLGDRVGIGTTTPTQKLTVAGAGNFSRNVTSYNVFVPQYIFSHTNRNITLIGANVWTNVTFDQEDSDVNYGVSHSWDDNTNHTFMVMEDGIHEADYDFDVEDTSVGSSDIDVAGRLIWVNGTEVLGSVFETDIAKKGLETELSHDFLFSAREGDQFIFQFVADNGNVRISTHGTFGDHPESATVVMKKIANLP